MYEIYYINQNIIENFVEKIKHSNHLSRLGIAFHEIQCVPRVLHGIVNIRLIHTYIYRLPRRRTAVDICSRVIGLILYLEEITAKIITLAGDRHDGITTWNSSNAPVVFNGKVVEENIRFHGFRIDIENNKLLLHVVCERSGAEAEYCMGIGVDALCGVWTSVVFSCTNRNAGAILCHMLDEVRIGFCDCRGNCLTLYVLTFFTPSFR
ncbi:hypothetical protein AVEN_146235-1 [Araneus ventricosus]|uniref:Uncharacterized protein n=1 Tax=Araneus ventricosus TaxID=182803 RepID=A0A4Y2J5A2_ARAVE|nr:hypothetical protein AVEN_146235-1 [Araneus ventricosus]